MKLKFWELVLTMLSAPSNLHLLLHDFQFCTHPGELLSIFSSCRHLNILANEVPGELSKEIKISHHKFQAWGERVFQMNRDLDFKTVIV